MHVRDWLRLAILVGSFEGCVLYADVHYRDTPQYRSVIESHHIRIDGAGRLDMPYETARILFDGPDLLEMVQRAYADLLNPGERPEFVVQQERPGHWSYENRFGQHSRIVELHRVLVPERSAQLVLYSEGERFFGNFRAVIEIDVLPKDADAVAYTVRVYAYPENSFSRFLARRLGLAERFFRDKTEEITTLACRICRHLASTG